jgi:DNA-binding GntR family transcriptional regulator
LEYRFSEKDLTDQYSLRGKVFNHILEGILSGRFRAGDSLVETTLAKEIGVSRTPVREAIRQLEREGLVYSIPNKGVFVNGLSKKDVEDIYRIRSLNEGLAVKLAAERMDEEQRRQLEETAALMEYYTEKNNMEQVAKLDIRFHTLIYESSKSKVLGHILSTLLVYVQQARLGSLKAPQRAQKALKEHKAILDEIFAGNGDQAEALMQEHIKGAMMNLFNDQSSS